MREAIAQSASYKWWVFAVVATGTFISVVDQGSSIMALPSIERHFNTDLSTVQWVSVGYALTISIFLLPMGRLADIVGRKQVYMAGFVVYILAAAMAGFSTNMTMLVIARVLQGVGSAMIQANGMAMIISVFPGTERGKALGSHLSAVGLGGITGPILGGLLVGVPLLEWRSVFLVNLPVGLIVMAASMIVLDSGKSLQDGRGGRRAQFDWVGAVLCAGALSAFLLAMTNGNRLGWGSLPIVAGLLTFVAFLATFIWWELRNPSPMLELRLFKRRLFAFGVTAGWLSFLASSPIRFVMPLYLQSALGYSPSVAGLIIIPSAITMTIMGPISGRLSDRFGWRKFNVAGISISAAAVFILAFGLSPDSPLYFIVPVIALQSLGFGLFGTPNNSAILSTVERQRYGVVSALTQLVRNSANVTSISITTAIVVATMGSMGIEASLSAAADAPNAFVTGLQRAFWVLGGLLMIGVFLSFFKGERAKEETGEGPPATPSREQVGEEAEAPTARADSNRGANRDQGIIITPPGGGTTPPRGSRPTDENTD